MDYRKEFEAKKTEKEVKASDCVFLKRDLSKKSHEQASIKGWNMFLGTIHKEVESLSTKIESVDRVENVEAFIIESHENNIGHGIGYYLSYGVVVDGNPTVVGPYLVRGGTNYEGDDFSQWFGTIRILEVREGGVVVGLESGELIVIGEFKKGCWREISTFNKKEEEKERKLEEIEKAKRLAVSLEERARLIREEVQAKYPDRTVNIMEISKELYVVRVNFYNRKYDASIVKIGFRIITPDSVIEKEHQCQYGFWPDSWSKNYVLGATINFGVEGNALIAAITYVYEEWSRPSRDVGKEEIKIKIK